MSTKVISLKELTASPEALLGDCYDSGQALIIELPGDRRVAVWPYDEDDDLVDRLIATNAKFRALLAKSGASGTKPFVPRTLETNES